MERIWDKFLTERDKAVIEAAGFGATAGYGLRPALVIVDVTYGFTGDRPEPILRIDQALEQLLWSGKLGRDRGDQTRRRCLPW